MVAGWLRSPLQYTVPELPAGECYHGHMNIYLASDHAGFELKKHILEIVKELGHTVIDVGPEVLNPEDDYPDFIAPCATRVAGEKGSMGIVFGWSGNGESMVANRQKGIRCATFYGPSSSGYDIVSLAREHNDANMLSIGAHFVTNEQAQEAAKVFLSTNFSGDERHVRRIAKF